MTQFQQQSPQKKVIHVAGAESCSTSEQAVNNEVHSSAPDMTADLCNNHQAASSVYSQPSLEHLRSTHALNQFRTLFKRLESNSSILVLASTSEEHFLNVSSSLKDCGGPEGVTGDLSSPKLSFWMR